MTKIDMYERITDAIIQILESHIEHEYTRPWIMLDHDNEPARNAESGRHYRGLNQLLLSFTMLQKGYLQNQWLTFNQTKQLGGHVRKGEKSTPAIWYKTGYIDKDKNFIKPELIKAMSMDQQAERGVQSIPIVKLYSLFNVVQTDGLEPEYYHLTPLEPLTDTQIHARSEKLIHDTGADIRITKSNRAFYNRKDDFVQVPLREQFRSSAQMYNVIFHELSHWTGAPHRLNRKSGKSFGDQDYAFEEIVAELSSAYVTATLGFEKTITNNASYISSWIKAMRNDKRYILKASHHAGRAADWILGGEECAAYTHDPKG